MKYVHIWQTEHALEHEQVEVKEMYRKSAYMLVRFLRSVLPWQSEQPATKGGLRWHSAVVGVLPIDFCVEFGGNMLKLMECVRTIPQVTCLKLSADARLRDPCGPCNKRIARHSAASSRPCTARTTRPWSCLPQQKRNVSGKLLAASVKQLAEVRLVHVLSSQEIRIERVSRYQDSLIMLLTRSLHPLTFRSSQHP